MELTGQCKEDFEKWYNNYLKDHGDRLITGTGIEFFNLLTDSMQWGVYVDFLDSVGINISIEYFACLESESVDTGGFEINIYDKNLHEWQAVHLLKNRNESRELALKNANSLYNDKHFVFPHDLDKLNKE